MRNPESADITNSCSPLPLSWPGHTSAFDNLSLATSTEASAQASKKTSNAFLGGQPSSITADSGGIAIPTDNGEQSSL